MTARPGFVRPERTELLTKRQRQVLRGFVLVSGGRKEVAAAMQISVKTLDNHLQAIYRALDVTNILGAVVVAAKLGLVSLAPL